MQLRRITSDGTWIPQIDGLRFVAIAAVVLFHISGQLTARTGHPVLIQSRYSPMLYLIGNFDRGVQLFFVISGYILARPFLRQHLQGGKPVRLQAYFLRRITRLEPPYLLSLALYTVGFVAFGLSFQTLLPHLIASAFYLHNAIYRDLSTINFVTWSLEVEVQFYLLAPVFGLIYCIRNSGLRRATLVACILAAGAINLHPVGILPLTLLGQVHYFLAGFLLADLLTGMREKHLAWDLVALLGWATIFLLPHGPAALSWLPLVVLVVYLAAFYGPISNWIFRRPFVALAGGMCYSLYLMHMLIISICFKLTRHLVRFQDFFANWILQVLLLGFGIAVFGTLYFVLIERPCMDPTWPQKLRAKLFNRVVGKGCS